MSGRPSLKPATWGPAHNSYFQDENDWATRLYWTWVYLMDETCGAWWTTLNPENLAGEPTP